MSEEKEKLGLGLGPADRRRQHSVRPQHLQDDWSGPASWRRLRAAEQAVVVQSEQIIQEVESVFMPQLAVVPVVDPDPAPRRFVTPPARQQISSRLQGVIRPDVSAPKRVAKRAPTKLARPLQPTKRVFSDIAVAKKPTQPQLAARRQAPSFLQHMASPEPVIMAPMAMFLSKYIMRKMVLVGAGGGVMTMGYHESTGEPFVEQISEVMHGLHERLSQAWRVVVTNAKKPAAAVKRVRLPSMTMPRIKLRRHHQRNAYARAVHRSRMQLVGFGLAVILAAVGTVVSITTFNTSQSTAKQTQAVLGAQTQQSNTPAVDTKPSVAAYSVAPNLPQTLSIPSLNVSARVQQVSTADKWQLPDSSYDTGWYTNSAAFGDPAGPTAALIDGDGEGVFSDLSHLIPGSTVTVTRGDGTTFTYQVMRVQLYDVHDPNMSFARTPYQIDKPCLNLVANGLHGDSSVLVFAVQQ